MTRECSPTWGQAGLRCRLLVTGLLASMCAAAVSTLHRSALSVTDATQLPTVFAVGWIFGQSIFLIAPGVLLGWMIAGRRQRLAMLVTAVWAQGIVLLVVCDVITFHWIGERFLSAATWRAATLGDVLVGHATATMIFSGGGLLVANLICAAAIWWIASNSATWWTRLPKVPPVGVVGLAIVGLGLIVSAPAIWNRSRTWEEMGRHSTRHPWCAAGLVPHHGVGRAVTFDPPLPSSTSTSLDAAIRRRDQQQRQLGIDLQWRDQAKPESLPDVLMVVIESFRHELVAADVMPNLWQYAEDGIHCRQHFSGGNATNHGMFSLLNGLEAIWFDRGVRYSPLLNRLLHQAGYELGFFGGHNDWRKFLMDGYISAEHFDVFEIEQPGWLASDRKATQRTAAFLDRDRRPDDPPRLAVLYLYSTHADYHSYVDDRIFQPAADDRFLIPYTEEARTAVWNRYKNSARSIDRFLAAVMRRDRVILVTGDHGESFLEDGVCGHGVRISKYQNMTPAVFYCAGIQPRSIDLPTAHADWLPTLLSALKIPVTEPATLDGIDLLAASSQQLASRLLVTRNYLRDDLAIIGPWTLRSDQPFGYRASVSLNAPHIAPLNAIDENGREETTSGERDAEEAVRRWRQQRFGSL